MTKESFRLQGGKQKEHLLKLFEPANVILMVAVLIAIGLNVSLAKKNNALRSAVDSMSGTLAGPQIAQAGDIVPAFRAMNLQGQASGVFHKESRTLLYIFSPGCGTCRDELTTWNRIAAQAKTKGVSVYGVSIDSLEDSKAQLQNVALEFDTLVMPNMATKRAYRVVSIPEVVLISANGMVEWVHYGALDQDKVMELLSKIKSGS